MILMNIGKPLGNAKLTDISRSFDFFRETDSDFPECGRTDEGTWRPDEFGCESVSLGYEELCNF
jgi:hypothetical protein